MERIINMVINMVLRKVVSRGVDAGINYAVGKGKAPQDMTEAELAQAKEGRDAAKRAKQAANLARRLGR